MSTSIIKFVDRNSVAYPLKRKYNRHACEDCRKRKKRCPHDYHQLASIQQTNLTDTDLGLKRTTSPGFAAESQFPMPSPASTYAQASGSDSSTRLRHNIESPTTRGSDTTEQESSYGAINTDYVDKQPMTPRSNNPVSVSDDVGHISSSNTSESETCDGPKFVGHLNPEGIFLATTRLGASKASSCDDSLGFWLPSQSSQHRDGLENLQILESHSTPASKRILTPKAVVSSLKVKFLPDTDSFNALRTIYFRDIHPVFPILPPELIPQMSPTAELSPVDVILMQTLCLAVATNVNAQPFLRFQDKKGVLAPKTFTSHLTRALVSGLDTIRPMDRLICVRVYTILSLCTQLSIDDHISAEYCARAISHAQTLQLHLDTAHVRKDDAEVTQVFLCVWALDRLNAAFHSRPLLIHARDIGRNMEDSIAHQGGCFRVFLSICSLLDETISLYRPSYKATSSINEVHFPSFEDLVAKADAIRSPTHILATIETLYHSVAMLSYRFHSLEDTNRTSISYLRSSLSAVRLSTIMGADFGTGFSSFPFVPYAISLALRVFYRELRYSKIPSHRAMARNQLLTICTHLEKYGDRFSFARRLAALAVKTVRELDKVAVSVLQARQNPPDHVESLETATQSGSALPLGTNRIPQMDNTTEILPQESEQLSIHRFAQYDPTQFNEDDFETIHNIPDLPDLFEHFDPDFNLDAVDFALVQNVGTAELPDFDLGPEMDWMSGSALSSVLTNGTENLALPSATT